MQSPADHATLHLAVEPSNGTQAPIFLDRIRSWFARGRRFEEFEKDTTQRKGLAITICILISVLLWFMLTLQETYTATLKLPTEVLLPTGVALTELPPDNVQVQVRGAGFQLLQLRYNPPVVPIDGEREQVNTADVQLGLPQDIIVESVSPRFFQLHKEERVRRRVPVRLRGEIETPDTHGLVADPRFVPDSVTVEGARSIVEQLDHWPTALLDLPVVRDSIAVRVPLADTLQKLVMVDTDEVILHVVARRFTEATREIDVIITGGVPSSQRVVVLDPSVVRVRYRVPLDQFEASLVAPDFFATVSYERIRADTTGRVRPIPHPPLDLILRDVDVIPPTLGYYEVLVE